jgi:hypothetical protein
VSRFKARPTTYNGIEMRSRLEAGFAAWLDRHQMKWKYEPRAYASPAGQYLPDFQIDRVPVLGQPPQTVYVEVKPASVEVPVVVDHPLVARLAIIWASEPDAVLIVARPGNPLTRVHRVAGGEGSVVGLQSYRWARVVFPGAEVKLGLVHVHAPEPWADGYWEGP